MLQFFGLTSDYGIMLWKIALGTSVSTLLSLWTLAQLDEDINSLFAKYPIEVEIFGGFSLSMGYLVPLGVVLFLSRSLRLHDRISDLFKIRLNFDVNHILGRLAEGVGWRVDKIILDKLRHNRRWLMNACFYHYATSSGPKIDAHLVKMALDAWTWFWVVLESSAVVLVFIIVALLRGHIAAAGWALGVIGVCGVLLFILYKICTERAAEEVESILRCPGAINHLRNELNAIQSRGA